MNSLDELPEYLYWAIFFGVFLYFALLAYTTFIDGSPESQLLLQTVFGIVAIGVALSLYVQTGTERMPVFGAAVCLAGGGLLRLGSAVAGLSDHAVAPSLDQASSIVIFFGIGLYLYSLLADD